MGNQPKKSSRLFIILGIALTLISMIGVYFVAHSASNSGSKGTQLVLMAQKDVPAGTTFSNHIDTTDWFAERMAPSTNVPPGAIVSVSDFDKLMYADGDHQTNQFPIYADQVITPSMFTNLHAQGQITPAYSLPANSVAVAFTVSEVDSSAASVHAGDYVDLIGSYLPAGGGSGAIDTYQGGTPRGQTQMMLQNQKVISIGPIATTSDNNSSAPGSTASPAGSSGSSEEMVFALTPQQALVMQHLKDFGASWHLSVVLVAANSKHNDAQTNPVTTNWYWQHGKKKYGYLGRPYGYVQKSCGTGC